MEKQTILNILTQMKEIQPSISTEASYKTEFDALITALENDTDLNLFVEERELQSYLRKVKLTQEQISSINTILDR